MEAYRFNENGVCVNPSKYGVIPVARDSALSCYVSVGMNKDGFWVYGISIQCAKDGHGGFSFGASERDEELFKTKRAAVRNGAKKMRDIANQRYKGSLLAIRSADLAEKQIDAEQYADKETWHVKIKRTICASCEYMWDGCGLPCPREECSVRTKKCSGYKRMRDDDLHTFAPQFWDDTFVHHYEQDYEAKSCDSVVWQPVRPFIEDTQLSLF